MSKQGRGSAMVMCMVVVVLLFSCEMASAATYTVGGPASWTFNVDSWPRGKRFRAGDVLVFNYNPSFHNVVAVTGDGYNKCTTPRGARVFKSGKDMIRLVRGQNFFICNFPGHCESGMKIAVTAV